ncbi:MAG TPA: 23S rRNA (adenine(2503)-C(2))-methyltransferase RlmN [Polyangiaceae bacterium]|nr:23S rRNA (adenine(2503)-C(2))-methyltransferase RlmN [Polyangiaceae bacterium]
MSNPPDVRHPLSWQPEEWAAYAQSIGEPTFRGAQIFRWLHHQGVTEPAQMTNLKLSLREGLSALGVGDPLRVVECRRAADGTRKILCELSSGDRIECVVIPMTRDTEMVDPDPEDVDDEPAVATRQRVTLCISTQVGCAMGCVFCASGKSGLRRGLKAHEIIAQVLTAKRHLEPNEWLRNIVFMGMGEPLHHYDETALAIRLIMNPEGIAIGPRRITVSTVGLVPGIKKLAHDFQGKLGLAISLHAPNDEIRSKIVPMNERYSIDDILAALRAYPLPKRRRITIEYTLIQGVNDSPEHAQQLARLLRGLRVKVNLIPMNSIIDSTLTASSVERVDRFAQVLSDARVSCSQRKRRGDDVAAACGQLALAPASSLVRAPQPLRGL